MNIELYVIRLQELVHFRKTRSNEIYFVWADIFSPDRVYKFQTRHTRIRCPGKRGRGALPLKDAVAELRYGVLDISTSLATESESPHEYIFN